MDWLYPPDSPWSTGVSPGTLFFYWSVPVVAAVILRLRTNWAAFNARKETHGLDDEARALRAGARARALRLVTLATIVGLGGWAATVIAVRLLG